MKQRLFSQGWIGLTQIVILASLTALTTIATTNQPSHAKGETFYCGKSKGIPVTFVRTQDSRKVRPFTVAKVKVYLLPLSVLKIVEK
ncbi:hypothetical protein [Dolichospermum flos-aquae]|uniref:hypothetical protein n=1 Tax=Dolichospermum flosaquae TaxID=1166 RepID=UPI001F25566E|nr:hypothetical protein [Dolichospermum flos-aquae]